MERNVFCPKSFGNGMDIVDRLSRDRPRFHVKGTTRWDSLPGTLRAIQRSVRDGNRTLETGCGASTVIFAAQGAHHTVLSPDAVEHERVRHYLKQIGLDDSRLVSIVGQSDLALPDLCRERVLDVAYIDGAHSFPYPAIDWHYMTRALKVGGKLIMDDIPIPATACVYRFMLSDPGWRLDAILDERAAAFTLIHEPPAEENYTLQPFNRSLDYGFASLPARARLRITSEMTRIRPKIASRYPGLRRAWKRFSHASDAND
jgi:hypothetical protein